MLLTDGCPVLCSLWKLEGLIFVCCMLKSPDDMLWYRSIFIHFGGHLVNSYNLVTHVLQFWGFFLDYFTDDFHHFPFLSLFLEPLLFGFCTGPLYFLRNFLNFLFQSFYQFFPHLYSLVFNSKWSKCLTWQSLTSNVWWSLVVH